MKRTEAFGALRRCLTAPAPGRPAERDADGGSAAVGYFDTVFSDDDLRISRSQIGDVFILLRTSGVTYT